MDTPNILSRRALLKGSTCLAAAVAMAPSATASQVSIPAVLSMLLAEYEASAKAWRKARNSKSDTQWAFDRALPKAYLFIPQECGSSRDYPAKLGHLFAGMVDPWTAKHRLDGYSKAALLAAAANGDDIAAARRDIRKKRRQLARRLKQYDAIKKAHGLDAAIAAEEAAYARECQARKALLAWRPSTLAEAAHTVCEVNRIGRSTEGGGQVSLNDLAQMLAAVGGVA